MFVFFIVFTFILLLSWIYLEEVVTNKTMLFVSLFLIFSLLGFFSFEWIYAEIDLLRFIKDYSGFIGAITGAAATIIAVKMSINWSVKQSKQQFEPILSYTVILTHEDGESNEDLDDKLILSESSIKKYDLDDEMNDIHLLETRSNSSYQRKWTAQIEINNFSEFPAVDFEFVGGAEGSTRIYKKKSYKIKRELYFKVTDPEHFTLKLETVYRDIKYNYHYTDYLFFGYKPLVDNDSESLVYIGSDTINKEPF